MHYILILLLVLSSAACNGLQPTPGTGILAPSPVVVPPPTPPPVQPSTPFTVALEIVKPQQTNASRLTWQALVTVTATPGVISPALPSRVEVDCGTGGVQRRDGFWGVDAFTCIAPTDGTYQTRAIASGAAGFSAQAAAPVSVTATLPPFTVALEIVGPGPVQDLGGGERGRSVTYSVRVTPDSRLAQSYEFDFGDGTKTGEISNHTQTHYYTTAGTYEAAVSVKSTDGRSVKMVRRLDITF